MAVIAPERVEVEPTPAAVRRRIRHLPVALLVVAGLVVRAVVVYGYWPAFWFQGDSGTFIRRAAAPHPGESASPIGYPLFLALFKPFGSLAAVVIFQHLAVVALAVLAYAMLVRRGVRPWLAALGCAPLLLDAHEIVIEHYILSDSLFTMLILGVLVVLLWSPTPRTWVYPVVGTLLSLAVLTRTVGLAVVGVVTVYLLLRRVPWRRVGLFAAALAVIIGGYLAWADVLNGSPSLTGSTASYLYSRVAGIADCQTLHISHAERRFCPPQPLGQRPQRGDYYLWNGIRAAYLPEEDQPAMSGFAHAVIRQQAGAYAALVARDTARYLAPGQSIDAGTRCLFGWWQFPATMVADVPVGARCQPLQADRGAFVTTPVSPTTNEHAGLRSALAGYSRWVTVPVAVCGAVVLLTIAAGAWRPRRDWLDAALPTTAALGMLVLAVATSMYDIRYGVPATALFGIAGALSVHHLLLPRKDDLLPARTTRV